VGYSSGTDLLQELLRFRVALTVLRQFEPGTNHWSLLQATNFIATQVMKVANEEYTTRNFVWLTNKVDEVTMGKREIFLKIIRGNVFE
jgi:hypothetical protein